MQNNYYLGIDVSKGYADFVILNLRKQTVENNFQIDDTFEGHHQLYIALSGFLSKHPDAKLFAAVESTGGYENNWYNSLRKFQSNMDLSVARVNPYGVSYNSKASLERIITDKQSAKNIAQYLISHPEKVDYQKEDYFSSSRRQWTFIKMLTKQKVQLLNQLESLLYISNPEILQYCRNGINLWTLKLLKEYPTAKHLAKARMPKIGKIPYITEEIAEEIVKNAKQSVASSTDDTTAELIKALVDQILSLRKLIASQIKQLEKVSNLPEVELLKSFKGIGTYSAVGLLIEIGSVHRFASVKKLASFFGVHPVFKQSGDGLSGYRMSKKGRKEPRQLLFNISRFAIVHNPLITEIYHSHLKKGMSKMAAIGAVMYKILRIIYGMLKHNKPFDAEVDRRNREKHITVKKTHNNNQNRRYQSLDSTAPVSRRQIKKRKEQELSQNDIALYTGSDSHSFPLLSTET